MFTTAVLFAVFAVGLILHFSLWPALLKLGSYWAKVHNVTIGRLLRITVLVFLAQVWIVVFYVVENSTSRIPAISALPIAIAVGFALPIFFIHAILRTSWLQALIAWLPPTLLVNALGFVFALFVNQFVTAAFYVPANSMAPTILGNHFTATCPTCGGPAYGSTPSGDFPTKVPVICGHFHVHQAVPSAATSEGDRIMVAKYLHPRRWDLILFHLPETPSIVHLKRLVGLPGETVTIKDGAVWINGKRLDSPPSLKGLNYVTDLPMLPQMRLAGTPQNPAVLGPGEYFVLGDFSSFSSDSRLWQNGTPGHPPYAVPASYIIGIATHIYWPPSRWRILR